MGVRALPVCVSHSRMPRMAAYPSIPGMWTSMNTRSKRCFWIIRRASRPSRARHTCSCWSTNSLRAKLSSQSSATKMFNASGCVSGTETDS